MPNRREILKAAGLSLGGLGLAACGTQLPPSTPSAITPNGYRFYGLKSGGIKGLGGDFQFSGNAMIDDRNQIVYGSYSQSSARVSTRALEYSLSNQQVTVRGERTIISDGDKITDHEVLRLGSSDLNFQGALALVAEVDTGLRAALMDADGNQLPGHGEVMPLQYLCLEKGNGVEVLVKAYDKTQEGHQFFGMFGDVDIHDDGNIVFVADYQHLLEDGTFDPRHGVFQMRQGQQPRLLLTNDAAAEQTTGAGSVGRYGLVDLHDNGNLVV
jgi:hypothetical protein